MKEKVKLKLIERSSVASRKLPVHLHREDMYSVVLSGAVTLRDEHFGSELRLVEGDLLVAPAGTVVSGFSGGEQAQSLTFALPVSFHTGRDWRRVPCRRVRDESLVERLVAIFRTLTGADASQGEPEALAQLRKLLSRLGAPSDATERAVSEEQEAVLHVVRERLEGGYAETLPLEELAGAVGWHAHHLQKLFRLRYGLSPRQYQNQLRLETAVTMLEEGESGVVIASRLGYSDQSHFIRSFVNFHGLTPGAYLVRASQCKKPVRAGHDGLTLYAV